MDCNPALTSKQLCIKSNVKRINQENISKSNLESKIFIHDTCDNQIIRRDNIPSSSQNILSSSSETHMHTFFHHLIRTGHLQLLICFIYFKCITCKQLEWHLVKHLLNLSSWIDPFTQNYTKRKGLFLYSPFKSSI